MSSDISCNRQTMLKLYYLWIPVCECNGLEVLHKRYFATKIRQKWNVIQTDVWLDIICGSYCRGSLCARWMDVWLAKLKPSWATRPSVSISHQQRPLSTVPLQYIPIRFTLTLSSMCHRRTASVCPFVLLLCISAHSHFLASDLSPSLFHYIHPSVTFWTLREAQTYYVAEEETGTIKEAVTDTLTHWGRGF